MRSVEALPRHDVDLGQDSLIRFVIAPDADAFELIARQFADLLAAFFNRRADGFVPHPARLLSCTGDLRTSLGSVINWVAVVDLDQDNLPSIGARF